ncbi:hypothetical protein MINS_26290 [Mycolicibacterium insubricum]|nr:hypothetical protein MINS_26290 [Mycolicibacterium insubricum]
MAADCLAFWTQVQSDLGASTSMTVDALLELAATRQAPGDRERAMLGLASAIERLAESTGAQNPEVLRLAWRLLRWRIAAKDPEIVAALRMLAPVLADVLGEGDPEVLSAFLSAPAES